MRKLASITLLVTIFLSVWAVAFANEAFVSSGAGENDGIIKVGTSADFNPFEYYDENGELAGFDIDLMNYIGERTGIEIEFVDMPFDKLIPAVLKGEVDCAISAISVTEERDTIIDYSREYLKTNIITFEDGQKSVKRGEEYAVVFKAGLADAPYKDIETPTEDERLYIMIDNALRDLSQDRTVMKLIEKYELNKHLEENAANVEYSAIMGGGDPAAITDEETRTSANSVPCSSWAVESIDKARKLNIINYGGNYNYPAAITREAFCELIYNYCGIVGELAVDDGHIAFEDTDNVKVQILNTMGIIGGKSSTEFAPNDYLTREEAATILFRLIDTVHPDWAAHEIYYEFKDSDCISDWAMNEIQTICNTGIMYGVGEGRFAPKDNFTTEQAIATIMRVYNGFGPQNSKNKWDNLTFADKLNANMPVDKNYMFSPLSIKMALMMAANGASGETQDEILKTMGIDDLNSYNDGVRLMLDKYSESDILKLTVSNSIWINSDKTAQRFSKDYKDKVLNIFDAESDVVTDKNAVSKINGWVNEKTEGKIPEIITEDNKEFWAMLVNAVYFKGRWQSEFNKGATQKDVFTSRDSSKTEIDFMNKTSWISYGVADGVSVVALPYLTRQDIFDENGEYVESKNLDGVKVSMYLMMSDGSFLPEEILNKVELERKYIALSVPKFNIEYSTGLNSILQTIGINKAFDKNAEFDKMFAGGNMWIDSTIHKTYIKVDEEGTEAAAVTGLGMAGSAKPPEPVVVKFNKPFTFVIKDDANGEVLFMGEYAFAE